MKISIKKEFKDLIFPLAPDEFQLLEQSILTEGVRDPLVVWQNGRDYLIDGHHRYQIITKHKIKKYPTKIVNFKGKSEVITWILKNQLGRRNCTPEGIAYLRGLRYRHEKNNHGGNHKARPQNGALRTSINLAEQYKVSKNTIHRDEKYADAIDRILEHFSGAEQNTVKNIILTRQVSLTKKETLELATLPQKAIEAVVIEGKEFWRVRGEHNWNRKQKKTRQANTKIKETDFLFYVGDAEKVANKHIDDESISCIITDPPYMKNDLPSIDKLGRIAQRVLKPSGFCIFYMGKMYLDNVMAQMCQYIDYYWMAIVMHHGSIGTGFNPIACHSHKVNTFYKPLLIFQKPPKKRQDEYFDDLIKGSGIEKSLHPWQQSEEELKSIVEKFAPLGSVVLDPFCGSGTTAAVCRSMARKCISIDIDSQCIKKAKSRV